MADAETSSNQMHHGNGHPAGHMGPMPAAGPPSHKAPPHGHAAMLRDYRDRFVVSVVLTVPILLLSPLIQSFLGFELSFPGDSLVLFLLSTVVYIYGGWPFLKGIVRELSTRSPGMMTLVAVAISVAYFYSSASVLAVEGEVFFWELATLIDVMLLGHWVEMRSVMGASRALEELARILPSEAHLVTEEGTREVPVEELQRGDLVLIKPGEKVPIDGTVVEGSSNVNEAMLTGESRPVSKNVSDEVIGGAINGEGALTVRVGRVGEETYLSQVIELVRQAQESRSRTQDLANRAAFVLVVVAVSVGALTLLAWLAVGEGPGFAVERSVTVMVISCPHALGLAVPLVVAVSTALAAGSGFLIRDRQAFERAHDIQAVVFDKTGTLTKGEFGVTDIVPLGDPDESSVLREMASLERTSEHPIARGILAAAEARGVKLDEVEDFRALPGKGVEGSIGGRRLLVVSPGYLAENGLGVSDDRVSRAEGQGKTVVFLVSDGEVLGAVALADVVRVESKEAIASLKAMGVRCMMLTGDNRHVAEAVAEELGLDEYYAEVLPQEKAEAIARVQKEFKVAMVGDGVNDAPALVQSDVGIAIGAGTDVAVQSADIILVRNDPRDVVSIISLSRRTYSKMVQNLIYATGYNAVAIPLAAGVLAAFGLLLSPAVGAALMSASTVVVAINARLLRSPRSRLE